MTSTELVRLRLRNQRLFSSEFQQPVEVVRWLGAVQAQDFHGAKWALALRMREPVGDAREPASNDAVDNEAIEKAFNQGEILRTHLLRPTWHFVAPEDIRWLLELTAPRINVRCGSAYRNYELDGPTLNRSNRILAKALQSGQHLTRAEIKAILNRAGIAADDGIRLGHILLHAELEGVVCSGPRRGKQFTYALLEERVPQAKPLTRDEALTKLTRTYFTSHGPATLPDFIWWSGLTTVDARRGIALIASELEQLTINDTHYWTSRANPPITRNSQPNAHLLPAFDEYNVAYKARDTAFAVALLSPTLLIDGRVVGNWKSTADKNGVTMSVTIAKHLKQPEKSAVLKAAHRYAKFLNVPVAHVSFEK